MLQRRSRHLHCSHLVTGPGEQRKNRTAQERLRKEPKEELSARAGSASARGCGSESLTEAPDSDSCLSRAQIYQTECVYMNPKAGPNDDAADSPLCAEISGLRWLALWKTAVSPTGDEQRRLLGVAEQPAELLEHRSALRRAGPLMELHMGPLVELHRGPWWSYTGAPGGATPGPLVELHLGP
ncbi:unnamed protein product [Arctogadus glacialis]